MTSSSRQRAIRRAGSAAFAPLQQAPYIRRIFPTGAVDRVSISIRRSFIIGQPAREFRRQLAGMAHGTDMAPYLSLRDQARIRISLPDIARQIEIGSILAGLDDKIELNRRMNETLEASARALFGDWFVDFGPHPRQGRRPPRPACPRPLVPLSRPPRRRWRAGSLERNAARSDRRLFERAGPSEVSCCPG